MSFCQGVSCLRNGEMTKDNENNDTPSSKLYVKHNCNRHNVDTIELFDEWWEVMLLSSELEYADCDNRHNLFVCPSMCKVVTCIFIASEGMRTHIK